MADKDLIEQVLINLIKNARENDATDIRISAGLSSGERPYIRIEDNGTGIEQEVLDRIFIPFFTTKPTGSGIGTDHLTTDHASAPRHHHRFIRTGERQYLHPLVSGSILKRCSHTVHRV